MGRKLGTFSKNINQSSLVKLCYFTSIFEEKKLRTGQLGDIQLCLITSVCCCFTPLYPEALHSHWTPLPTYQQKAILMPPSPQPPTTTLHLPLDCWGPGWNGLGPMQGVKIKTCPQNSIFGQFSAFGGGDQGDWTPMLWAPFKLAYLYS